MATSRSCCRRRRRTIPFIIKTVYTQTKHQNVETICISIFGSNLWTFLAWKCHVKWHIVQMKLVAIAFKMIYGTCLHLYTLLFRWVNEFIVAYIVNTPDRPHKWQMVRRKRARARSLICKWTFFFHNEIKGRRQRKIDHSENRAKTLVIIANERLNQQMQ